MRPNGWETAFLEHWKPPPPDGDYKGFIANHRASFESGADAMLEGLLAEARRIADSPVLIQEHMEQAFGEGTWVFIPDENDSSE